MNLEVPISDHHHRKSDLVDVSRGLERMPILGPQASIAEFGEYTRHSTLGGKSIVGGACDYDGCWHPSIVCNNALSGCGCASQHGQAYLRYSSGTIDPSFDCSTPYQDTPIYECNANCICPMLCPNRVVGPGLMRRLLITSHPLKGFALHTREFIPQGSFVIEYAGEVIRSAEARRRWAFQKQHGLSNYIICVKEHTGQTVYRTNIDPRLRGNAARFINHSCSPNLAFRTVRVDSVIPCAALFASSDIEPGEELSFDYGGTRLEATQDGRTESRLPCHCGATNCSKYLPYDSSL